MKYWLMKTEPEMYSIDDLKKDKKGCWDGVRNYQARNFIMEMKKGDLVLFYHSNTKIIGVAGIAKVVKESYPDHTAYDKKDEHFDSKSKKENPTWYMVDVGFVKKFKEIVTLDEIKKNKKLKDMRIVQKGSRLSVTPVTEKDFETVVKLSASHN